MNRVFALAIAGSVIIFLVALFFISIGIAYSGVLSSMGFSVMSGEYSFDILHPDIAMEMMVRYAIYGAFGLTAGILGLVGGRISNLKGGILLITAGVISVGAFQLVWGIASCVLFIIGGIIAITKRPLIPLETTNITQ